MRWQFVLLLKLEEFFFIYFFFTFHLLPHASALGVIGAAPYKGQRATRTRFFCAASVSPPLFVPFRS